MGNHELVSRSDEEEEDKVEEPHCLKVLLIKIRSMGDLQVRVTVIAGIGQLNKIPLSQCDVYISSDGWGKFGLHFFRR